MATAGKYSAHRESHSIYIKYLYQLVALYNLYDLSTRVLICISSFMLVRLCYVSKYELITVYPPVDDTGTM